MIPLYIHVVHQILSLNITSTYVVVYFYRGGLMVSALVLFKTWPGTLCCVLGQDTFTVPLSTKEYKWVLANCWGKLTNCRGVTCDGLASHPGGVEILLAASCHRIPETGTSSGSYVPVGSKASF